MTQKRSIKYILRTLCASAALLATAVLASCELETSNNGALDGMWHVMRTDTLATGGFNDLSNQRLFWSFQGKLLVLEDRDALHPSILMRFNNTTEGKLSVSDPYINDRDHGDQPLSAVDLLKPYGINANNEEFIVETLKGGKLILKTGDLKISFVKF